jgi:hypothetical protein
MFSTCFSNFSLYKILQNSVQRQGSCHLQRTDGQTDKETERQTDIGVSNVFFFLLLFLNALKFTKPTHGDHEMSLSGNSARFLVCRLSSICTREIDKTNKSILNSYLNHTLVHYTEHQIMGFFSHYSCFYD